MTREQEFEKCEKCGRPKTEFIGEDMRCWWCWVRTDVGEGFETPPMNEVLENNQTADEL